MSQSKIQMLFMGQILAPGLKKEASKGNGRTGLFFSAYNILRELLMRDDVKITIYAPAHEVQNVENFCSEAFPGYSFTFLSDCPSETLLHKYTFFVKQKAYHKKHKNIIRKAVYSCLSKILRSYFYLHTKLNRKAFADFDLIFSPFHYCPNLGLPKYTLLHDCIPVVLPQYYPKSRGNVVKLLANIRFEDHHFSNSEATKRDFIKYCPQIDPQKITVSYLACSKHFIPAETAVIAAARKKYNIPNGKKYVFSLCTLEPRKNLIRAVKTFVKFIEKNQIDDLVFVLGGGHWKEFIGKLEAELGNLGKYQDKIIRAGYIDDEDVPPLYSGAEWFVYTSQYEGFGLPPLEAMSCGCPVITSNNSSLPEVVGEAGIMIDYDSDEQHIKAYEDYYFNPDLRRKYSEKGLARAKEFSWAKCADQMLETMKRNLSK